ncbi:3-deoxy-manno-octulosonate cytidylyltransferase [Halomonas heilongjiangensis]|uniref:3-deoxy-manno-octulosonate cytidylyltransferase n=1 Tax=Halomonas heilongjiangensis TaxID=1387883 RepID=A0A2N7TMF3_9GAMM|nr:3-deoxy-manno-octulosonate cytidylyltransferase [Halomonas heilongjiangensis]PMR69375.1 3-deoxy-manno-octulosonate cytidylyltransferase [Halomonas heilongjiangensis]PXX90620.1 3-deoxy-manno-octulosonate cytidylyltransferase [Halomonas heilongjiangensis]
MSAPNSQRIVIVIPARYGSTRLPGKPLADLLGKPMIQWVYEKAQQVEAASYVVVATDDLRIADVVQHFGGEVIMTSPDHSSGTERLIEVMEQVEADIYINLQGDEPLIRPSDIDLLALGMLSDRQVKVGTLCHPIEPLEAANTNVVKVVVSKNGDALYFSRSLVPYPREDDYKPSYLKHVGVYAYRREMLSKYTSLGNSQLEHAEQLEQLRLLEAGIRVRTFQIESCGPGVDTPAGLEQVRALLKGEFQHSSPRLSNVRLLITDVDGVLTDGGIYYDENGECLKRFHVRDGLGVHLLEENGIRVAVLSGRDSAALRKRIHDLGVSLYLLGVKNKEAACLELMKKAGVVREQTACIGDDAIDLPAFAACGLAYAVADAPEYVKRCATGVLSLDGGCGAFRELADAILEAQGKGSAFSTAAGFQKIANGSVQ